MKNRYTNNKDFLIRGSFLWVYERQIRADFHLKDNIFCLLTLINRQEGGGRNLIISCKVTNVGVCLPKEINFYQEQKLFGILFGHIPPCFTSSEKYAPYDQTIDTNASVAHS